VRALEAHAHPRAAAPRERRGRAASCRPVRPGAGAGSGCRAYAGSGSGARAAEPAQARARAAEPALARALEPARARARARAAEPARARTPELAPHLVARCGKRRVHVSFARNTFFRVESGVCSLECRRRPHLLRPQAPQQPALPPTCRRGRLKKRISGVRFLKCAICSFRCVQRQKVFLFQFRFFRFILYDFSFLIRFILCRFSTTHTRMMRCSHPEVEENNTCTCAPGFTWTDNV
jgi:hypothetical protein